MSVTSIRGWSASRSAIVVIALTAIALSVGSADARKRHHHYRHHHYRHHVVHRYDPPVSHVVLDAKTGKVLESYHADAKRYPASLTKVMTLYLLFERLDAGKLKLSTPLRVSRHAAAQAPSKLGLRPGSYIRVKDAIKAVVTKSANDVAVVIGEAIGGTESHFAEMMTEKAHQLGMTHTHYANASGLPNRNNYSTAYDQAILGRAIQQRFPKRYHFFSTRVFDFHGRAIPNHDHLLGRIKGVDGIKTGYIRASGFNLMTSVQREHRHIVAVVFGGRTSRSRDALMSRLIRKYFDDASTTSAEQSSNNAPALAVDAGDPPLPPSRPSAAEVATAQLGADAAGAEDSVPDTVAAKVATPEPPVETKAATSKPADPAGVKPATATAPEPKPDLPKIAAVVPAPTAGRAALADSTTPEHAPLVPVVAAASPTGPAYPASFWYLLVALIGSLGSLLSALRLLVGRFMPQRRAELI